jgi:hypothetical protein
LDKGVGVRCSNGGTLTIKLDKDVRDFLVAAVTRQGERSRNDLFRKHGKPPIA